MKGKSITYCFLKLKAKEKKISPKSSEEGDFSVENLGFFFQSQCLHTQLPAEAAAME